MGDQHFFEAVLHQELLLPHPLFLGGNFRTDFISPLLVFQIRVALLGPDIDKLV